jgi:hypothetical protein
MILQYRICVLYSKLLQVALHLHSCVMQKFVLKECRTMKKHTAEAHVPLTVVVKGFVCPQLQVRFVSARMGTGQVHKANVVSVCRIALSLSVKMLSLKMCFPEWCH